MTNHFPLSINNHRVTEVVKGEMMATVKFDSFVLKELFQLFCFNQLFLFHCFLPVGILKPFWTPKANQEEWAMLLANVYGNCTAEFSPPQKLAGLARTNPGQPQASRGPGQNKKLM